MEYGRLEDDPDGLLSVLRSHPYWRMSAETECSDGDPDYKQITLVCIGCCSTCTFNVQRDSMFRLARLFQF